MAAAQGTATDRPAVNWALLVVRIVVGIIFMAHGAQKLFGAFGGFGVAGTVKAMGALHLGPLVYLVIIDEFFGGLGLFLGVLTRFSAFWLIVDMLGAILLVHGKNGFFLGGPKPGFEYPFALIGMMSVTLLAGPGKYALGRLVKILRHPVLE